MPFDPSPRPASYPCAPQHGYRIQLQQGTRICSSRLTAPWWRMSSYLVCAATHHSTCQTTTCKAKAAYLSPSPHKRCSHNAHEPLRINQRTCPTHPLQCEPWWCRCRTGRLSDRGCGGASCGTAHPFTAGQPVHAHKVPYLHVCEEHPVCRSDVGGSGGSHIGTSCIVITVLRHWCHHYVRWKQARVHSPHGACLGWASL